MIDLSPTSHSLEQMFRLGLVVSSLVDGRGFPPGFGGPGPGRPGPAGFEPGADGPIVINGVDYDVPLSKLPKCKYFRIVFY